jgi:Mor family transcriptional regulator
MKKKRIIVALENHIINDFKRGLTLKEIKDKYKINEIYINVLRKKAGLRSVPLIPKNELNKTVFADYKNGLSKIALAQKYNMGYFEIDRVLRKNKKYIHITKQKIKRQNKKIIDLFEQGMTVKSIAQKVGLSIYYVHKAVEIDKETADKLINDSRRNQKLIESYHQCKNVNQLSDQFAMPVVHIRFILRMHGKNNTKNSNNKCIEKIISGVKSGKSLRQIAEQYNFNREYIRKVCRDAGVKSNYGKILTERNAEICRDYKNGMQKIQMVEKYGLGWTRIKQILNENKRKLK